MPYLTPDQLREVADRLDAAGTAAILDGDIASYTGPAVSQAWRERLDGSSVLWADTLAQESHNGVVVTATGDDAIGPYAAPVEVYAKPQRTGGSPLYTWEARALAEALLSIPGVSTAEKETTT